MKKILILIISMFLIVSCQKEELIKNTWEITQKTKTIIALWDSLTAWYNLDLSESYPMQLQNILNEKGYKYNVVNAWVSWDTSEQLLKRLDLYINDEENLPELAILVIWWNDWLRWNSTEELSSNIENIINKLKEKNTTWKKSPWGIKVVLWWMKIPPNLWINYANDFSKLYSKLADKTDSYLIDFFLEWVAWNISLNLDDWIHPNKQWYSIIAKNVFDFLLSNNLITND